MCNGKCKCSKAFNDAKTPAAPAQPPVQPAAPANDKAPEAPKKKCCGGSCHPKK